MSLRRCLLAAAAIALLALPSLRAGTLVDLATPLGTMRLELFDGAKPITTANFLGYVNSGAYGNSFAHRLEPGFVMQGGGYRLNGSNLALVPSGGAIPNEAGPFPEFSNVYGTIAMAKLGNNPDSATSEWFINLADNSANLDFQNGGFTVFGRVVAGFDVLAAFANFAVRSQPNEDNVVIDVSGGDETSPFTRLPVTAVRDNSFSLNDLIFTTWTVVPEPGVSQLLAVGAVLALGAIRRHRLRSRA